MPCNKVLAWLRHAGHEDSVLDEVSPPLRCLASDFGKTQSHQRSYPPLVRPPASGSLGSPICPTARADGPSMAQRRSLGILPRGLDKRAHLGEQQGATPNPQHRGQLTGVGCNKRSALHRANTSLPCLFGAKIGRVVISQPPSRPPHDENKLSHRCNRYHRHGCIGKKIMVCQSSKRQISLSGNGFILKARK